MRSSISTLILVAIVQMLVGCGALSTIRYHKPSIENADVQIKHSCNGISFSFGAICLHVSEGDTKELHHRAITLVGIPLIPGSLTIPEPSQLDHFDVTVWLIPELGNTDYSIDIPRIELEFDNGIRVQSSVVKISRFRTHFENIGGLFTTSPFEKISNFEHWNEKTLNELRKPVELWDWTRLIIRFTKPDRSLNPANLNILGLLKNGINQDVPTINFTFVSENRQAFSGTWADGTSYFITPDSACRKLQEHERVEP